MSDSHEKSNRELLRPSNHNSIDEEAPMMRSVSIMGSSSTLHDSRPFASKLSFGKPPPLGFSRQESAGSTPDASFVIKREWNGVVPAGLWDVKGENLELIPTHYPLERTHREIFDDACNVATRISDVLRELSIETEFDDEKAKATCVTNDFVCFRIRLYAANDSGQPVVVEVQRRNGPASSFMRSCRAILNSAEGKLRETKSSAPPPFIKSPISNMACLQAVSVPVVSHCASAMESILTMLRSSSRDTNVLGFENLCSLTDSNKSDPMDAIRASKSIMLSGDIREEIISFTERDVFVADEEEMIRHTDQLRQLSLRVLANSTLLCCKDGSFATAIQTQKWFAENMLPSLLDELKQTESHAHNAFEAARCLRGVIVCSDFGRNFIVDNGGVAILQQAHTFGICRHELLASETKQCLDLLDLSTASS